MGKKNRTQTVARTVIRKQADFDTFIASVVQNMVKDDPYSTSTISETDRTRFSGQLKSLDASENGFFEIDASCSVWNGTQRFHMFGHIEPTPEGSLLSGILRHTTDLTSFMRKVEGKPPLKVLMRRPGHQISLTRDLRIPVFSLISLVSETSGGKQSCLETFRNNIYEYGGRAGTLLFLSLETNPKSILHFLTPYGLITGDVPDNVPEMFRHYARGLDGLILRSMTGIPFGDVISWKDSLVVKKLTRYILSGKGRVPILESE